MAKTIFTNGKIYTLDKNQPFVESVVVENGNILDLGAHEDMMLQWGREGTKIVDLQEKMATPGLIDSHMHLSGVAFQFLDLNLTGVTSKREMIEKIRERANVTSPGKWLTGLGFDENLFDDGEMPTIQELDEAAPHCPVFIKRICHHAFLVNSKALEMANYHPSMEVPTGGSIVLDPDTKKPTGLLLESASTLITDRMPEKTYEELKHGLSLAMEYAMKSGLTSIHTNDPRYLGGLDQTYKMYDELLNQERKGLRCNLLIDYPFLDRLKETGMYAGYGNDTLQIGAVKIFADGAFGGRTALLSEPYLDASGKYGEAMHDQETLFQMVKEARDHSMPVAIHTIGDQAVENVLQVLEQFPSVKHRDRIIHVSLLREDLIRRLAKPSLVADIQPRFVVGDYPWVQDRLGKERIKYLYAWKSLLSAGVMCAGGSDAPVEPVDPLLGIHAAVTQRHPRETHNGWNEKEKLSMREALEVFTIGGACATNEEGRKGTIAPGKLADMTVFSRDLFEIEHPDELLDTEIEMTVIGGEIVYRK
ncbi:amidohydrolase [Siminovitchia fortis]|uniref:amidohydrolase n=2 Tax=Bacillales TaxID=1385 RepID=UPI0011A11DDC|nr:amidohydrolase [Siminovitchia fortis]